MHCTTNINSSNTEMSVLERQHLLQPISYMNNNDASDHFLSGFLFGNNDHMGRPIKPDPGMVTGWAGDEFARFLNYGNNLELGSGCVIPRTISCPPDVVAEMAEVETCKRKENVKKRKADKGQNSKAAEEEQNQEKKKKEYVEEEGSKITEEHSNSKSTITNASKKKQHSSDKSNVSDAPKQDYIHVRARRGQATDSHSLAERVRREKISERMKYLQDLVPGCNKITGKAGMLDEIINYVQSLQKQVEFLSMKLSVVTPQLDCEASNNMFKEQMFPACTSSMVDPGQLQFDALTQGVSGSGLDIGAISSEAALRRTISAPVHIPDTALDSSCYNALNWDAEVQNMFHGMEYQQGRLASLVSQPFAGYMETGHVKMEM